MSLQQAQQQRRQRRALEREQECDRAIADMRVMTITKWCEINGFTYWTGQRLIKAGKGPVIIQISDRRIGITVRANREWQKSRERS